MKKFKKSERGLTFSLEENNGLVSVGQKFNYIVDTKGQKIIIIPSEEGTNTVSKKKSGKKIKPLFDIRSKQVKKLVSNASYLEVEVKSDCIIVKTYKKVRFKVLERKIYDFATALGLKQTGQIVVPKTMLAAGSEYDTISISNYVSEYSGNKSEKIRSEVINTEINQVKKVVSLFSGAGMFDYGATRF